MLPKIRAIKGAHIHRAPFVITPSVPLPTLLRFFTSKPLDLFQDAGKSGEASLQLYFIKIQKTQLTAGQGLQP